MDAKKIGLMRYASFAILILLAWMERLVANTALQNLPYSSLIYGH